MKKVNDKEYLSFRYIIEEKFFVITGFERNEELKMAIYDLTGDTYYEMRKMTSKLLKLIEEMILIGKYDGYVNGKKINKDCKTLDKLKNIPEDMKMDIKNIIKSCWFEMQNKQKIGIEKLANSIKNDTKNFK